MSTTEQKELVTQALIDREFGALKVLVREEKHREMVELSGPVDFTVRISGVLVQGRATEQTKRTTDWSRLAETLAWALDRRDYHVRKLLKVLDRVAQEHPEVAQTIAMSAKASVEAQPTGSDMIESALGKPVPPVFKPTIVDRTQTWKKLVTIADTYPRAGALTGKLALEVVADTPDLGTEVAEENRN
jgi:hypothetical protein